MMIIDEKMGLDIINKFGFNRVDEWQAEITV